MPTATNGEVALYYEADGSGETVVCLGDIGYGAWQWGWQHAGLAGPYELVVPDLRGAGRSSAPPGPYSVGHLAADVQAVLEDHGVRRAHVLGAGLGGMVALELDAISERPRTLTLVGTAASGRDLSFEALFGPPDDRAGLERSLEAAFSREFIETQPDALAQIAEWRAAEDADREAWDAQHAAVEAFDVRDSLYELTTPALVLHGSEDRLVPPAWGRELAEGLPRGEFVAVEGAGHLAHIEYSKVVNDELLGFLHAHGEGVDSA